MPEAFKKVRRYSGPVQCFSVLFMVEIIFCNPDFRQLLNGFLD